MPNLLTHINLALRVQDRLEHPVLAEHRSSFLLGCTTPDIRAMTKGDRYATHFAPYDCAELRAGMRGMFEANAHLARADRLPAATRAFLTGFICHLVADHGWVGQVYQPFFGDRKSMPDAAAAKVWDRALQLEMDRRAYEETPPEAYLSMAGAEDGVNIGFIDSATLKAWREWVEGFTGRGFSWDRLRFLARRHQDQAHLTRARQVADEFLESVPRGMTRLAEIVPPEALQRYEAVVVEEAVQCAQEYLACV